MKHRLSVSVISFTVCLNRKNRKVVMHFIFRDMASAVFNQSRLIFESIECCKKIVSCLDGNLVALERIMESFQPNDFFARPKIVLDRLIQYLLLVHKLDFYGDWEQEGGFTLRLDSTTGVFGDSTVEENELILNLLAKTNRLLERKAQVK